MRKSFLLFLFFIFATTGVSCGHDDFFDEELIYRNDSIIYPNDNNTTPNDSTPTDTTKKDTTRTDTTQVDSAQQVYEGIHLYEITKYMNQVSSGSVQGADCYGDYLFQFQDKNAAVYIYNLKEKKYIGKVILTANTNNHCNNASFSRIFYHETDEFPLIYVSGSGSGTYNHVQVYRITRHDPSFTIEQIQEIVLPKANADNDLYWTDIMIYGDHLCVSTAASEGDGKISFFKVPPIYEKNITLTDEDITDSFHVGRFTHHQGANINGDLLYIFDGVPAWGDTNYLRIIDLNKKKDIAKINIMEKGFKCEPEGAFFYNGDLFNASNRSGIYKFKLYINN